MALTLTHLIHEAETETPKTPLVIAHGLYGSARNFNSIGKKLAAGRKVVMVDMRNHGASPWDDAMTYPEMAGDLAETVDSLCGGKALVLGHSMGGKAAMALALSFPEKVAGLIVADIAPVDYDHSHAGYIDAMLSVELDRISRRSEAEPYLAEAVPEKPLRAFLLQNLVIEGGKASWRLNLQALKTGIPTLLAWPSDWPASSYDDATVFLHGGASDYVTDAMQPRIRGFFPSAEFVTLDGAGHWLHAEKPAEFIAAVEEILAEMG